MSGTDDTNGPPGPGPSNGPGPSSTCPETGKSLSTVEDEQLQNVGLKLMAPVTVTRKMMDNLLTRANASHKPKDISIELKENSSVIIMTFSSREEAEAVEADLEGHQIKKKNFQMEIGTIQTQEKVDGLSVSEIDSESEEKTDSEKFSSAEEDDPPKAGNKTERRVESEGGIHGVY